MEPKKVLVLLANGFEDVEAITPIDYLRRAGIEVLTVAVGETLLVKSKWGQINIIADIMLTPPICTADWDAVILPGGMPGTTNLAASKDVTTLLNEMHKAKKLICAICAAPVAVLAPLGILDGKKFTCYPGLEEAVAHRLNKNQWLEKRVVVDGNIITSRGAGTAGDFSITIIEYLLDETEAQKIKETVLL